MIRDEKVSRFDIEQKGESFIEGLKIVNKRNGQKDWVLTAKRADITDKGTKANLKEIEMKIEKKDITIHAGKGTYDMNSKNLAVEGQIIARTGGYTVTSEDIVFDSGTGNIRTAGNARITGSRFSVEGKGLEIDNSAQKVRLLRDVKATFNN